MYVWDISKFNRAEFFDYSLWIANLSELNAALRETKAETLITKGLPGDIKFLQTIPSDKSKIINFLILKNTSIIVLLFNYKLVVLDFEELAKIEDFTQAKLKYLSIFISDAGEFKDIQAAALREFESLLIHDNVNVLSSN